MDQSFDQNIIQAVPIQQKQMIGHTTTEFVPLLSSLTLNVDSNDGINKNHSSMINKQMKKTQVQHRSDRFNKISFMQNLLLNHAISSDSRKINKRIFILYSSGCVGANQKLQIFKDFLRQKMMMNSYLCDYKLTQQNENPSTLISPLLQNGFRVQYQIQVMSLIQSSINSTIQEVVMIAKKIQQVYQKYDAFIVIAGFDVMCYISTLLSFMLENLSKCVIFTGGHFPISYNRNDFINNIIESFTIISLSRGLNDVLIVCKNKGYRANRTVKIKENQMDTIKSPNMHSLASIDIKIRFKFHLFLPIPTDPFSVFFNVSQKVHVLKIHLYINKEALKYDLKNPNVIGYVIQSYSAANLPQSEQLLQIFKEASQNDGKIFLNISQNIFKQKKSIMKQTLEKYQIYFGGDMTVQAALAKLSYLIGKGLSKQQITQRISMNLRGQLTETKLQNQFQIEAEGFMQAIEEVLEDYYPTSTQKIFTSILEDQIGKYITHQTTREQFKIIFKYLKKTSEPLQLTDVIDRNYLLHHAVIYKNIELISYFLSLQIDRDILDENQCSAFFYAIKSSNKSIIQLLFKRNCHVICPVDVLMDFFIEELRKDNVDFFQMLYHIEFKTSLCEVFNRQKRNVAHIAAILGCEKCLDLFISKFKFQFTQKDIYGSTVQDYVCIYKKKIQAKILNYSLNSTKSNIENKI